MGLEVDGEDGEAATVVVGVKLDAGCGELLTWALVKVARPNDRVFAVHVLPDAPPPGRSGASFGELDALLAAHEGFCELKQIDLQVRICIGGFVGKALVREAAGLGATRLVLGAAKNSYGIGSPSASVAKYCAKKLPPSCWVLAVNNGRIVFEKQSRSPLTLASGKCCNLLNDSNSNSFCTIPDREMSRRKSGGGLHRSPLSTTSSSRSRPLPARSSNADDSEQKTDSDSKGSWDLIPFQSVESSSLSVPMHEFSDREPGWPLLRKAIMQRKKAEHERSSMSVVQWVMQLPSRHQSMSTAEWSNSSIVDEDYSPRCEQDGGDDSTILLGLDADDAGEEEIHSLPRELECLHDKYASMCRLFSYQELAAATSNFSPDNLIGKGGSSHVYKGLLSDGRELAIKILMQSEEALGGFLREIEMVTMLHHPNIVSLFGFCFENNNLMLVYDFFARGSLEENLHGAKSEYHVLSWPERYKVAIGVAEALAYLHTEACDQPVIHRDVKSSNILLSDNFEPQLTDFGLAERISASSPYITCSDVAGTFGYLAPEYFMFGKVNEKIDVFAFGVILLELLSGRKPIDNDFPKGKESLLMWAKPILQGEKPKQLLDPKLGSRYDDGQVERMILAASLCITRMPRTRPKISVALELLRGDESVTNWARSQASLCSTAEEMDDVMTVPASDFRSHLNLALLDVEDDALSVSSTEHCIEHILAQGSLEAYLKGRWSRSSSFD